MYEHEKFEDLVLYGTLNLSNGGISSKTK